MNLEFQNSSCINSGIINEIVLIYISTQSEKDCVKVLSLSLSFRLEMVASRNFYDKTFEIVLQPKDLLTTFTTSIRNQFEQQQQQQQKNHVNFNFLAPLGSTSILSYLIHNSSRILTDEWAHQTISIPTCSKVDTEESKKISSQILLSCHKEEWWIRKENKKKFAS